MQVSDQWQTVASTAIKLRVPYHKSEENFCDLSDSYFLNDRVAYRHKINCLTFAYVFAMIGLFINISTV
jgi:hypothetical protein